MEQKVRLPLSFRFALSVVMIIAVANIFLVFAKCAAFGYELDLPVVGTSIAIFTIALSIRYVGAKFIPTFKD